MKIPTNATDREAFFLDLTEKCLVSRAERKSDYQSLRSWFLFGSGPQDQPAPFNKIGPHIDQLLSFIYSAETTRFSIDLGAGVPETHNDIETAKVPILTRAVNDEWLNSNADAVFAAAAQWALVFNTSFIKLVMDKGIHPYMVDPGCLGVLREDIAYLDRQEAVLHTYYITKSELADRLFRHKNRDALLKRITAAAHQPSETPEGVDRILLSAVTPDMHGQAPINGAMSGVGRMRAEVAEDTVEMRELYVWDSDRGDYQIVTVAEPDIYIYDRPNEEMFLKGELPFIQICPNPQYDYFWGASEVQKLIGLQDMRNRRVAEILELLSLQVKPPTFMSGFTGILDEKNFALNRAGGLLGSDMPGTKAERLAPDLPDDLFKEIAEIDAMFAEASGISSILAGRGEVGVRSAGHASQLARLGASRAKKRALVIEDSLEKMATLYLKLMQVYDDTHFTDTANRRFIAAQFTKDFVVKVDAHSNSPIFMEDLREMVFNLRKIGAIDNESVLDLLEPPMKQLLKGRLAKMEAAQAQVQATAQVLGQKPGLKAVGGGRG